MTEQEWLTENDPRSMLEFFVDKSNHARSDRKLRLFAVACARRLWQFTDDERSRAAVESAEDFADGKLSQEQLNEAAEAADRAFGEVDGTTMGEVARAFASAAAPDMYTDPAYVAADATAYDASNAAAELLADREGPGVWVEAKSAEGVIQCGLLRDIVGNPFRPIAFDAAWLTSTAVALARDIYEKRAFDQMPILADALQDAGCDNTDILSHCRDPEQVHVRGCWVVDLVLGKE